MRCFNRMLVTHPKSLPPYMFSFKPRRALVPGLQDQVAVKNFSFGHTGILLRDIGKLEESLISIYFASQNSPKNSFLP